MPSPAPNDTTQLVANVFSCSSEHTARRKRGGKKSSITKRIKHIKDIINSRGSRTKLRSLQMKLKEVLKEAIFYHEHLMVFLSEEHSDYNDEYIEELGISVDDCISEIDEYLVERENEPPSKTTSEISLNILSDDDRNSFITQSGDDRVKEWCEGNVSGRNSIMEDHCQQELVTELSKQLEALNIAACKKSRDYGNENKSIKSGFSHGINKVGFNDTKLNNNEDHSHLTSLERGNTHCPEISGTFNMPIDEVCNKSNPTALDNHHLLSHTRMHAFPVAEHFQQNTSNYNDTIIHNCQAQAGATNLSTTLKGAIACSKVANTVTPPCDCVSRSSLEQLNSVCGTRHHAHLNGDHIRKTIINKTANCKSSSYQSVPIPPFIERSAVPVCSSFSEHIMPLTSRTHPVALSDRHIECSIVNGRYGAQSHGVPPVSLDTHACGRQCLPQDASGDNYYGHIGRIPVSNINCSESLIRLWPHTSMSAANQFGNSEKRHSIVVPDTVFCNSLGNHLENEYHPYDSVINGISRSNTTNFMNNGKTDALRNIQFKLLEEESGSFPHDASLHLDNSHKKSHDLLRQNSHTENNQAIDKWIDELPEFEESIQHNYNLSVLEVSRFISNQNLPRIDIPHFDGSAIKWVDFIIHFKELVHSQPYLSAIQKMAYLQQHLKGEARRAVNGFNADWTGYRKALHRLKFMFGQRANVAHAHLSKVTTGKQIKDDDIESLHELYYNISDCLSTLERLKYYSDLNSSDVLRQAIRRLPTKLQFKWSEYSYKIRSREEPTLYHLEQWLKDRIMASRDPYLPQRRRLDTFGTYGTSTQDANKDYEQKLPCCVLCQESHPVQKCKIYKDSDPKGRFKVVKDKRLCINCLQPNHQAKDCKSKFYCFSFNCNQSHHSSLHDYFKSKIDTDEINVSRTTTVAGKCYLKIVPVCISTADGTFIYTYAFLDDGSEATLVKEHLAKKLQLRGQKSKVKVCTITDDTGEAINTEKVSFNISGIHSGATRFQLEDVYVLPEHLFNVKPRYLPDDFLSNKRYKHLQGYDFNSIDENDIQILIGTDHYEVLLISETIAGVHPSYPIAAKTPLGWTIYGRDHREAYNESVHISHVITRDIDDLNTSVQKFWSTESFGTQFNFSKECSVQDKLILMDWDKSTVFVDGHYTVKMPWKEDLTVLPNNKPLAERRFFSLLNKFKCQPELHKMYKANIDEYIDKGYAVKLSTAEANASSEKTSYLPHHPVSNVNKPGKVRTVFDAAARYNGTSLNNMLNTGPDLVNNLVGVVLRFRTYEVAFAADIEAMFHQVRVSSEDSEALRFLWKEDINDSRPPDVFKMLSHIFGAKSSPSCAAYALLRTAHDNKDACQDNTINTILRNFYVDDLLKSVKSDEEAIQLIIELISVLKEKGFNLTKFISNSANLLSSLPVATLAHTDYVELDADQCERTLGIRWNIKKDAFTFLSSFKERPFTKRGILQVVSSVFDPLGFLAPFTVRAKIIFQSLWRKKRNWDDDIDEKEREIWSKWLVELQQIHTIEVLRCYILNANHVIALQLHIFGDASELAFGAVAYIRVVYEGGRISCYILVSKSRLAPIKTLTIPRLELQAGVLGVRMKNMIVNEIDIELNNIYFWTDSTITLQYLNNTTRRFKVFVANRVAEIHEHSDSTQWFHVSGAENPADDLTRGLSINELSNNCRWLLGPDFLWKPEDCWPVQNGLETLFEDDPEIKSVMKLNIECCQNLKRISSWPKLLRVVAWIRRWIKIVQHQDNFFPLTCQEIMLARTSVLRSIQKEYFSHEIETLKSGATLHPGNSLEKFNAFYDTRDGLLRIGGRLKKAEVPYAAKHQVILPSKDYLVKLLVVDEHRMNRDCGVQLLLSRLQQNYWIIGARRLAKQVVKNCFECKKRTCKPLVPLMADMPSFRLEMESPVFYNSGVDFFGPLSAKSGRRFVKRWGCIFTCLVTRAVHLELAESLSTDAFIHVLERFINRRGHPKRILSDCGTNFKGADKELRKCLKELEQEHIDTFAARRGIEWIFNPPNAPHMGGVWERMVKSVKLPLKNIVKDRSLSDLQLCTVFTEIESLVNSRPLTPITDDVNDYEALTPNHFILGRESPNLPFNVVYNSDNCSRKRWREIQYITNHFWKRWRHEYLPTLSLRPKWRTETRNLGVGDLVIMVENELPRGQWKLARVINVFPGSDHRVRVVEIKTSSGTYTRPVSKLCLLEESGITQEK